MKRRPALALGVVALLVATACGSTVAPGQLGVATTATDGTDIAAGSGLDAPPRPGLAGSPGAAPAAPGAVPAAGNAPGGSASRPASGTTNGSQPAAANPAPAPPGQPPPPGQAPAPPAPPPPGDTAVPGVSDTEIHLGFFTVENAQAAAAALGQSGLAAGDDNAYLETVVAEINATGGIAGRQVVPVVHVFDGTSPAAADTQYQAACTTWTEDNEVFAVLGVGGNANHVAVACLADRGVPVIANGLSEADTHTFEELPLYVEQDSVNQTRIARLLADGLHTQGFYQPENPLGTIRLGVVQYSTPEYVRARQESLEPALARLGIEITEVAEITPPRSSEDTGGYFAQIQSAVLRFNSQAIDHVVFLEYNAQLALYFQTGAENQGYRPQYGLSSQSGPQALMVSGLADVEQMRTARTVGWIPVFDAAPEDHPPPNVNQERCNRIMSDAGLHAANVNDQALIYAYCADPFFLQQALSGVTDPTPSGLIGAIDAVGTSWQPLGTFASRLGPGRHDGAEFYRGGQFFDDCTCFHYTTELLTIPS